MKNLKTFLICMVCCFGAIEQAQATIIVICNGGKVSHVYYEDDGCGLDVEVYGNCGNAS